jgi:hypothetical protein
MTLASDVGQESRSIAFFRPAVLSPEKELLMNENNKQDDTKRTPAPKPDSGRGSEFGKYFVRGAAIGLGIAVAGPIGGGIAAILTGGGGDGDLGSI